MNGERLRKLRKSKGLTQEQLGNILGVKKASISSYEKEERTPTIEHLISMIQFFNVSSDYLLGSDFLIEIEDKERKKYIPITKEEIDFINELKKDKMVYNILLDDPIRGANLIKNKIG